MEQRGIATNCSLPQTHPPVGLGFYPSIYGETTIAGTNSDLPLCNVITTALVIT